MGLTREQRAERKAEAEAYRKRSEERRTAVLAVVKSGKCPDCGRGLRRNLSLSGWWQCEQVGAPSFRKDPNAPACHWQGFTV